MKRIIIFTIGICCFPILSYAQGGEAWISGSARDWLGAVVPGTQIKIIGNGVQKETSTDRNGFYMLQLPNSTYTLVFSKHGFCEETRGGITVTYPDSAVVDVTLFPCSIQSVARTDMSTNQTVETDYKKRPYEERVMALCKSNEETHVSLRYGGLVETGPSVKFSGFRVERSDKILFPVVVLLNGREFFADRVEITADAMTMIGVRVPIGSDRPSFKDMTLTLCSKESF